MTAPRSALACLLVATWAVTACAGPAATPSAPPGRAVTITTEVDLPAGRVSDGSTIGGSPFCPGGTFADTHGNDVIGLVDRTFTCSDGTLRIGFTPTEPVGDTQSGDWAIVSGTGAYAGLAGGGEMQITYDAGSESTGRETFTGTVTGP